MERGIFFAQAEMLNMPRMWDKEKSELQMGFKAIAWVWPPEASQVLKPTNDIEDQVHSAIY